MYQSDIDTLFCKASQFANSNIIIPCPMEPYDFSKDPEIIKYIQRLTTADVTLGDGTAALAYEPFDIDSALNMTRSELAVVLKQRDEYCLHLYKRAATAIQSFSAVENQRKQLFEELQQLRKEYQEQAGAAAIEKNEKMALQKEVKHLRRIIRKHVEPERAEAFLKSVDIKNAEAVVEASRSAVMAEHCSDDAKPSILYLFE